MNALNNYKLNIFPQIMAIMQNKNNNDRVDALDALEKGQRKTYPLNIHRFKRILDTSLTDQFWMAMQCKAAQPTLVVKRIKDCKITTIYDGSNHFRRAPLLENCQVPMDEEVFIDRASKTVLFVAEQSHFVAVNRLLEADGKVYIEGLYFEDLERSDEQFQASASDFVQKMEEMIKNQNINQLYEKHVAPLDAQKTL